MKLYGRGYRMAQMNQYERLRGKHMRMVIVVVGSLALGLWIAANSFVSPETILNVIRH
jgi:hypothetical protein